MLLILRERAVKPITEVIPDGDKHTCLSTESLGLPGWIVVASQLLIWVPSVDNISEWSRYALFLNQVTESHIS